MSLDGDHVKLTKKGTVTIGPGDSAGVQIIVEGFQASGATCRDVAVLAALWAIGELQREVMRTIERPGGGRIGIG